MQTAHHGFQFTMKNHPLKKCKESTDNKAKVADNDDNEKYRASNVLQFPVCSWKYPHHCISKFSSQYEKFWRRQPRDDSRRCPCQQLEHLYIEPYKLHRASNAHESSLTCYGLTHPFLQIKGIFLIKGTFDLVTQRRLCKNTRYVSLIMKLLFCRKYTSTSIRELNSFDGDILYIK